MSNSKILEISQEIKIFFQKISNKIFFSKIFKNHFFPKIFKKKFFQKFPKKIFFQKFSQKNFFSTIFKKILFSKIFKKYLKKFKYSHFYCKPKIQAVCVHRCERSVHGEHRRFLPVSRYLFSYIRKASTFWAKKTNFQTRFSNY